MVNASFRINRALPIAVGLTVALMVLPACGSSTPKGTPQSAWSGTWKIKVDFGKATITVNKKGTLVTKIGFDFTCGSVSSATGSQGPNSGDPGWRIDDSGNFALENEPFAVNLEDPGKSMAGTMSGRFAKGGNSASGEWKLDGFDGTKCSAEWASKR